MKTEMKRILKLFTEIEEIYNDLESSEQHFCAQRHNETSSLPHCIRWGMQATEELGRVSKKDISKFEKEKGY